MEHRNSTAFGVMGICWVANRTITQRWPPTEHIGMPTAVASLTLEFSTSPSATLLFAQTIWPPSQTLRHICEHEEKLNYQVSSSIFYRLSSANTRRVNSCNVPRERSDGAPQLWLGPRFVTSLVLREVTWETGHMWEMCRSGRNSGTDCALKEEEKIRGESIVLWEFGFTILSKAMKI